MGNIYPALFSIIFDICNSDFVLFAGVLCFYSAVFVIVVRFLLGDL